MREINDIGARQKRYRFEKKGISLRESEIMAISLREKCLNRCEVWAILLRENESEIAAFCCDIFDSRDLYFQKNIIFENKTKSDNLYLVHF